MLAVHGEQVLSFRHQHLDAKLLIAFQAKRKSRCDFLAAPFIRNLTVAHNIPLDQTGIYVERNVATGCADSQVDGEPLLCVSDSLLYKVV